MDAKAKVKAIFTKENVLKAANRVAEVAVMIVFVVGLVTIAEAVKDQFKGEDVTTELAVDETSIIE